VGAEGANPSGRSNSGKSYVVFGKIGSSAIDLSTIADANNPTGGFVINGEAIGDASYQTQYKIYLHLTCHLD
jgi:hypothetical protein